MRLIHWDAHFPTESQEACIWSVKGAICDADILKKMRKVICLSGQGLLFPSCQSRQTCIFHSKVAWKRESTLQGVVALGHLQACPKHFFTKILVKQTQHSFYSTIPTSEGQIQLSQNYNQKEKLLDAASTTHRWQQHDHTQGMTDCPHPTRIQLHCSRECPESPRKKHFALRTSRFTVFRFGANSKLNNAPGTQL